MRKIHKLAAPGVASAFLAVALVLSVATLIAEFADGGPDAIWWIAGYYVVGVAVLDSNDYPQQYVRFAFREHLKLARDTLLWPIFLAHAIIKKSRSRGA